jgi:PAS domain S-box-containing protein
MGLTTQDFELLLQANRILSSKLNVTELLEAVMELATRVVKAEAASILLLDERTNELYFNVALGGAGHHIKEIRLKVGEGLAGWVAEHKQAVIVNDARTDPRWSGRGDEKSEFTTRQLLAVPIMTKGRLLGVVEAINKSDGSAFTDEDQRAFEAFASQAAVAIENARLFSQVKEEKDKLDTLFREMSDGALMIDEAGTIRLMNDAAGQFLGASPADVVGQAPLGRLLEPFDVVPPLPLVLENIQQTETLEMRRRQGKAFYLASTVTRLTRDEGDLLGYLFVLRDVTESRQEEILKRNFLSLISHKLKTPLVTITGYAPLLLEDASSLSDFQKKALTTIKNQGLHLTSLVDKLLTFSLVESESLNLKREKIPVKRFVEDNLAALKHYLDGENARLTADPGLDHLPPVWVDAESTREVFRNVIENAVKFNRKSEKTVAVAGKVEDSFVRVLIRDNGPGVPPEEQPKIFHKFYQIEESFTGQVEGAGLGLALAKRIVEAHGGSIGVDSPAGQGTTIFFTLPVAG